LPQPISGSADSGADRRGQDVVMSAVTSGTRMKLPVNPALIEDARQRAERFENRIADRITTFAGSMRFVYLHAIWFACWIGFRVEPYPFGLLTMIVSLEAIFLSTFVMIGQNRQAAFQQAKSDRDYGDVNRLLVENTNITRAINQMTEELHHHLLGGTASSPSTK